MSPMRNLARSLISAERRADEPADTDGEAAVRVCAKLRDSLSALAGAVGFRTLLTRALGIARAEVPSLANLHVGADGLLSRTGEMDDREAAQGGVALVAHLLELLATFIGEALTRRLVQQTWPRTASDMPTTRGKT